MNLPAALTVTPRQILSSLAAIGLFAGGVVAASPGADAAKPTESRSTERAGVVVRKGSAPATATGVIQITSAPPNVTSSTTASFVFSSTRGSTYCVLDDGAWHGCSTGMTFMQVPVGTHTFTVEVVSKTHPASGSYSWRVVAGSTPPPTTTTTTTTPTTTTAPTTTTNATTTTAPPTTTTATTTTTTTTTTATTTTSPTTTSSSPPSSAEPPVAPGSYTVPSGAVAVSSSAQLSSALAAYSGRDIVLADGTYDAAAPFTNANADHLYAEHPRGAVLTAGLVMGANGGPGGGLVRGVAFDVSAPAKALGGGIVHVWGPGGVNTQVLDCTFDGNGVIPVGLLAYNPQGLVAQRLTFTNFTDEGIRASDNKPVAYGGATPKISSISDISVDDVSRPVPGASNGTAEAGLFIGHPVTNGVRRIRVHNVSWSGIELANNAWDTTYSDLTIDMTGSNALKGVGVYLEHFSIKDTFTDLNFTGVRIGFNAEWDDGTAGNAAAHGVVIKNGVIDAHGWSLSGHTAGVYLDAGTESTTVSNVAFRNQNWAGIGAYQTTGTNVFAPNDFSGLGSGAATVSSSHV